MWEGEQKRNREKMIKKDKKTQGRAQRRPGNKQTAVAQLHVTQEEQGTLSSCAERWRETKALQPSDVTRRAGALGDTGQLPTKREEGTEARPGPQATYGAGPNAWHRRSLLLPPATVCKDLTKGPRKK